MDYLEGLKRFGKGYASLALVVLLLDKIVASIISGSFVKGGLIDDSRKCAQGHDKNCKCTNCGFCGDFCSCGLNKWWRLFYHICRHRCEHRVANFARHFYSSVEKNRVYMVMYIIYLLGILALGVTTVYVDKKILRDKTLGVSATTTNVLRISEAKTLSNVTNATRLWLHPTDIAVPAQVTDTVFITTKFMKLLQYQSTCGESDGIMEAKCDNDTCEPGKIFHDGSGPTTGVCLDGICEVQGWCPVESSPEGERRTQITTVDISDTELLIKSHVYFKFSDGDSYNYSNVKIDPYKGYDPHCLNDASSGCPMFSIDYMVDKAIKSLPSESKLEDLKNGAVISVRIKWECYTEDADCHPNFAFTKLDIRHIAKGYNYTDAEYPFEDKGSRIFIRAVGVLFIIESDASAYRLSWTSMLIAAAGAFTLLSTASHMTKLAFNLGIVCCFFGLLCRKVDEEDCPYDHPPPPPAQNYQQ